MKYLVLSLVVCLALATGAHAVTIYSVDTIIPVPTPSPSDDFFSVDSGATLTINSGGKVTATDNSPTGLTLGVAAGTNGHLVLLAGGEFEWNANDATAVAGVRLLESSTATMSGGILDVNESNTSSATGFFLRDSSSVVFSGGLIHVAESGGGNNAAAFQTRETSTLEMTGGMVTLTGSTSGAGHIFLRTRESSTATISGGMFAAANYVLDVEDTSIVTIFGSNFMLNGSPVAFGDLAATSGDLTGILADGNAFDWDIFRTSNATITLATAATVPEPSSLALAALSIAGLAFTRRRRR